MKKRPGKIEARGGDDKSFPRVFMSQRRQIPIVSLLTDFGSADYFVAAVKGVILTANPKVRLVDITHEIPPHDVEAAAFTLLAAHSSFPAGTIHLAVVDPGVGSSRKAIVMRLGEQFFVGPDNGIFSYVFDSSENLGLPAQVFHLTNVKYHHNSVSPTFHGRDIFAPVAAALSLGVKPAALGKPISNFVRLQPLRPTMSRDGRLSARIIHIDRFGNCITNISRTDLTPEMIAAGVALRINGKSVTSFRTYFAEETTGKERLFGIWGSAGFLEIAATNESAAKLLKAQRGDAVVVIQG